MTPHSGSSSARCFRKAPGAIVGEMKSVVLLLMVLVSPLMAGKIGFTVAKGADGKASLREGDFDVWEAGPGQTNYATKKNKSMAKYHQ